MTHKAATRLVEFQPYTHRNECCAVGILSFRHDGQVRAHAADKLKKVRALDPAANVQNLRDGLAAMAAELQANPDMLKLYLSGFGSLRVASTEGCVNYTDEADYDKGIHWSLLMAVEPNAPVTQRDRAAVSRLFVEVKNTFDAYGWMAQSGQGLSDHRIVPRYMLSQDEGLVVDFALKNGTLNCIQTVDYRHNPAQRRTEASAKLLTLGIAPQMTDKKPMRYALIAGATEPEAKAGIRLAERVADDVFIHDSSQDMQRLFDNISVAMGQEPMPILSTI